MHNKHCVAIVSSEDEMWKLHDDMTKAGFNSFWFNTWESMDLNGSVCVVGFNLDAYQDKSFTNGTIDFPIEDSDIQVFKPEDLLNIVKGVAAFGEVV